MGATPFQTSKLLSDAGVIHGFSLRGGGVSLGPFASLNLGRSVGDEPASVEENLRRLLRAARLPEAGRGVATVLQVHGDRVLAAQLAPVGYALRELCPESSPAERVAVEGAEQQADALVALEPGAVVGVRGADCLPLLLHDPKSGAVAAVHSGWRGTRLSIAARGARALAELAGADPARVLAAIGPCIGRCCYQVSRELAALFRALFGLEVADDPAAAAPTHLDLRLCVERALLGAGLRREHIEQVPGCTACDASAYFSHRRDAGRTGRHLAFVAAGRVG